MNQFAIDLIQGAVSFRSDTQAAQNLKQEINASAQSLKEIALRNKQGGKPIPEKPMECQCAGGTFSELFCDPNICPAPSSAEALVTLRGDCIRLTSEAESTRLIEGLEQCLQNQSCLFVGQVANEQLAIDSLLIWFEAPLFAKKSKTLFEFDSLPATCHLTWLSNQKLFQPSFHPNQRIIVILIWINQSQFSEFLLPFH